MPGKDLGVDIECLVWFFEYILVKIIVHCLELENEYYCFGLFVVRILMYTLAWRLYFYFVGYWLRFCMCTERYLVQLA